MKNPACCPATELQCARLARAAAEQALAEARQALSAQAGALDAVRDSERQRIARDIHDDLGQNLLALKIELSIAQVGAGSAHPLLRRRLNAMMDKLDLAIRSLRATIHHLEPPALGAGLRPALATLVAEFIRINHIDCRLEIGPGALAGDADPERDAMLYRIVQEALANVARHAQARAVELALRVADGQLQLLVRDNGIGVAARGAGCGHGCGLAGIRQRVLAHGGAFAIGSPAGGGTLLHLTFPLAQPIALL
jgi:signal transduction histidine kinase